MSSMVARDIRSIWIRNFTWALFVLEGFFLFSHFSAARTPRELGISHYGHWPMRLLQIVITSCASSSCGSFSGSRFIFAHTHHSDRRHH